MDFKKVKHINQKYKDTVNGFIKQIEILFPKDNPYFNIVTSIKHIILLFYYKVFESKLLNESDQQKFLELLVANNKDFVYNHWRLYLIQKMMVSN